MLACNQHFEIINEIFVCFTLAAHLNPDQPHISAPYRAAQGPVVKSLFADTPQVKESPGCSEGFPSFHSIAPSRLPLPDRRWCAVAVRGVGYGRLES